MPDRALHSAPIANFIGNPFGESNLLVSSVLAKANSFRGVAGRRLPKINTGGFESNQYKGGIAVISIVAD